jgi:DNA replication protein DnaC
MTNESTIEKMVKMRLLGMASRFRNVLSGNLDVQFTADELIGHLVDAEWDERYNRRIAGLMKNACFKYKTNFESIDYTANKRIIDKNLLLRLSSCDWIRKKENILVVGPTGIGKSYIASALGNLACVNGFQVLYQNSMKLFSKLKYAKADGSYPREMKRIQKSDLLIIDDFGLEKLDGQSRLILLEIIEDRNGFKSTLITSQLPVSNWFDIIGDDTIADAVCDRISHSAHKIDLSGGSMRKYYSGRKSSDKNLDETCHPG